MTQIDSMSVFDRRTVRARRDRSARRFEEADFLVRAAATSIADRLKDVNRQFPRALDLGCHGGEVASSIRGLKGVEWIACCDLSPAFATRAAGATGAAALAADEELLPFAEAAFDLVVSGLSLHWVNDLPGALIQIRRSLVPDGLFLGTMLGGDTLTELRQAWLRAEAEIEGGAGPRVSPFADIRDAAGLLQRAGFALPVADVDELTVTYEDPIRLMHDLRAMGETNSVAERRRKPTRRDTLMRAAELYRERHSGPDGRISATFQILNLAGWAPHDSQQQPMRPGSARHRLADALGAEERPAGDKARPN